MEVSAVPKIKGDEIVGVRAIISDIIDRKCAEEELEQHREHLEEMVQKRTAEL